MYIIYYNLITNNKYFYKILKYLKYFKSCVLIYFNLSI